MARKFSLRRAAPLWRIAPGDREQRALIKLFDGGSLRRKASAVVEHLRADAPMDEQDTLSKRRLSVLTLAMRRQQAGVVQRAMITK
jgi:hypothetical protein